MQLSNNDRHGNTGMHGSPTYNGNNYKKGCTVFLVMFCWLPLPAPAQHEIATQIRKAAMFFYRFMLGALASACPNIK